MPATYRTARRLVSPSTRQQDFLRTLIAERNSETLVPVIGEVSAALAGQEMWSDLIDRVMALPRATASAAPAPSRSDATQVDTPSAGTRAGRMLLAGGIEATTTLPDGRHATVTVRTRKRSGRGWANGAPGEEGARTTVSILGSKVGWINLVDGRWMLTLRTRNADYRTAILAVFEYAASGQCAGDEYVQEASRCGRCFRTLTDPVSIDRGIGPECFGRDTGSQHVAADRAATGDAVVAEPRVISGAGRGGVERVDAIEAAHDAAFAAREREQETAAFESDPDYQAFIQDQARRTANLSGHVAEPAEPAEEPSLSGRLASLSALAAELEARQSAPASSVPTDRVERARHIIAEALDSYLDDSDDKTFALRVFDDLAGR